MIYEIESMDSIVLERHTLIGDVFKSPMVKSSEQRFLLFARTDPKAKKRHYIAYFNPDKASRQWTVPGKGVRDILIRALMQEVISCQKNLK